MTTKLQTTVDAAVAILRAAHPRADYAERVIRGEQRWSGADLQGKARRYGAGYATQRRYAEAALRAAGGTIITVAHGRRVTAVESAPGEFEHL